MRDQARFETTVIDLSLFKRLEERGVRKSSISFGAGSIPSVSQSPANVSRLAGILGTTRSLLLGILAPRQRTADFEAMGDHMLRDIGISRHQASLLRSR